MVRTPDAHHQRCADPRAVPHCQRRLLPGPRAARRRGHVQADRAALPGARALPGPATRCYWGALLPPAPWLSCLVRLSRSGAVPAALCVDDDAPGGDGLLRCATPPFRTLNAALSPANTLPGARSVFGGGGACGYRPASRRRFLPRCGQPRAGRALLEYLRRLQLLLVGAGAGREQPAPPAAAVLGRPGRLRVCGGREPPAISRPHCSRCGSARVPGAQGRCGFASRRTGRTSTRC